MTENFDIERLESSFDDYHRASMILRSDKHNEAEVAVLMRDGYVSKCDTLRDSKPMVRALLKPLVYFYERRIVQLDREIETYGYQSIYEEVQVAFLSKIEARKDLLHKDGECISKDALIALYKHLKGKYGSEFRDDWDSVTKNDGHYLFLDFFYLFKSVFHIPEHENSYLDVETAILEYKKAGDAQRVSTQTN